MKIKELIKLLRQAEKEVGNLEVALSSDAEGNRYGNINNDSLAVGKMLVSSFGIESDDTDDGSNPTHLILYPEI